MIEAEIVNRRGFDVLKFNFVMFSLVLRPPSSLTLLDVTATGDHSVSPSINLQISLIWIHNKGLVDILMQNCLRNQHTHTLRPAHVCMMVFRGPRVNNRPTRIPARWPIKEDLKSTVPSKKYRVISFYRIIISAIHCDLERWLQTENKSISPVIYYFLCFSCSCFL